MLENKIVPVEARRGISQPILDWNREIGQLIGEPWTVATGNLENLALYRDLLKTYQNKPDPELVDKIAKPRQAILKACTMFGGFLPTAIVVDAETDKEILVQVGDYSAVTESFKPPYHRNYLYSTMHYTPPENTNLIPGWTVSRIGGHDWPVNETLNTNVIVQRREKKSKDTEQSCFVYVNPWAEDLYAVFEQSRDGINFELTIDYRIDKKTRKPDERTYARVVISDDQSYNSIKFDGAGNLAKAEKKDKKVALNIIPSEPKSIAISKSTQGTFRYIETLEELLSQVNTEEITDFRNEISIR